MHLKEHLKGLSPYMNRLNRRFFKSFGLHSMPQERELGLSETKVGISMRLIAYEIMGFH